MRRSLPAVVTSIALLLAVACGRDANWYLASGDRYMAAQKYNEAIIQYRNALDRDPRSGRASFKLAQAYSRVGALDKALHEYLRAGDLLPKDDEVQLAAGRQLLLSGDFEGSKVRAQGVLGRNKRKVEALVLLGNSLAGLEDLEGAIKDLEQAVAIDPARALSFTNLAVLRVRHGDLGQAEAAFREAIRLSPQTPAPRLALANFLWAANRRGEVEAELVGAIGVAPDDVGARTAVASFYLASGNTAEAEVHLKAAANASPAVDLKIFLADFYLGLKRIGDATQVLERASKLTGGYVPARTRIAAILYDQGKHREAHEAIDQVLLRAPEDVQARVTKGRFLALEGRTNEALEMARGAVKSNPRSISAEYLLGELSASSDPDTALQAFNEIVALDPGATPALLQLAGLELTRGHADRAAQFAADAVKVEPSNWAAHVLLGNALLVSGRLPAAEDEARTLMRLDPRRADGYLLAGHLALVRKDAIAARARFEQALAAEATSAEAGAALIRLDIRAGRTQNARARVEAMERAAPGDGRVLVIAAEVYDAAGDRANLERCLRGAIDKDAGGLRVYLRLVRLYAEQKRLPEAEAEFRRLAASHPGSTAPQTMIGVVLEAQRRFDEAQAAYEAVLRANPRAGIAANNLAWLYAERGTDLVAAVRLAQAAKREMPDETEVDDTLGWVYHKKGMSAQAVAILEQCVTKVPTNPTYQYHFGLALLKMGDRAKAKAALETALSIAPDFPGAADARQILGTLR